MFEAKTQIRVRYGETDKMGYVYYGNYALYYEEGRTSAMRSIGFPYSKLEESGIMLPVMSMEINFSRPAFYDELLTVHSTIRHFNPDSKELEFYSYIYNEAGKKLNECRIKLAFVDAQTRRKTKPPQDLCNVLMSYFENNTQPHS